MLWIHLTKNIWSELWPNVLNKNYFYFLFTLYFYTVTQVILLEDGKWYFMKQFCIHYARLSFSWAEENQN